MKLKFKNQAFQEAATAAVCDVFSGQPYHDPNAIKKFTESKRPRPLRTNANFAKDEFKELWKRINHKTAYTVEFSSEELIRKAIEALDRQIDIPKLTYMVKKAQQVDGDAFAMVAHESHEVYEDYTETGIKYDLIGKVAEGTILRGP